MTQLQYILVLILGTWARISFEDRTRIGKASMNYEVGGLGAEGSSQG